MGVSERHEFEGSRVFSNDAMRFVIGGPLAFALAGVAFQAGGAPLPPEAWVNYISKASGMRFMRIDAGTFLMGSPKEELGRPNDEGPGLGREVQHEVVITRDYYLGKYEVTRGQFRQFVMAAGYKTEAETDGKGGFGRTETGYQRNSAYNWRNVGFDQADDHPVVNVTWNDAREYAAWLSKADGRAYRSADRGGVGVRRAGPGGSVPALRHRGRHGPHLQACQHQGPAGRFRGGGEDVCHRPVSAERERPARHARERAGVVLG